MLDNRQTDGRTPPPVYNPEELSWLTGIPDPEPDGLSLDRIDWRLDRIIDRLIALRDAIDVAAEDAEDDDPGGCTVDDQGEPDDEGEHSLGWSEHASRLGLIDAMPSSDDREDDDPKEDDNQDRCGAYDDTFQHVQDEHFGRAAGDGDDAEEDDPAEIDDEDAGDRWDICPGDSPELDAQAQAANACCPSRLFPTFSSEGRP